MQEQGAQYEVTFSFVSSPFSADPSVVLNMSIDFGSGYVFTGNGSSNFVGFLRIGVANDGTNNIYCYNANVKDNVPIHINRPSTDTITVTIKDGDVPETIPEYDLIINFKPVF